MTERYERLLTDSCPQRRGDWGDSWALHSHWLPQALALCHPTRHPNPSPAHSHMSSYILCGGQTLPHHSNSCLVISCVSVKPFPLSPCLFLVILTQHHMTHNTDLSFPHFLSTVWACAHSNCACMRMCAWFHFFSAWWFGIFSVSKHQLQQPWHISECFFSRSPRKWSAPHLLIPLHSTVHQGDFVFTA